MNCSKCEYDNLPDATQCESCGEPLIDTVADQENSGESVPDIETAEQEAKPVFLPVGNAPQVESIGDGKVAGYPNTYIPDHSGRKMFGKSFRITVTVIVLAFALIAGLGFMFRNKILKTISPERYLQVSLSRTFSDKKYSKMLDTSKYDQKPVKFELSVGSEGVGAEASVMYDAKGEKALFEAVLDDGTTVYDDNILYISRELIAFSIPEIVTETTFLTIDPATFEQDLKDLGVEGSLPPDYMDNALDLFFGKTENGETDMDKVAQYYREAQFLEKYAEFSEGETVTEEIDGETYKLDTMCYEITEDNANEYLQAFFDNYKQGFMDGMGLTNQGYDAEASQEQMDAAFEVFDNIRIDGDIVITYYVDSNDYVRKIVVDEFELTFSEQEGTFSIEFEMLLGGKKNPTDNIEAVLTLGSGGEEVDMCMNWDESFEDGVFQGELELFFEGNNTEEMGSATIEIEWDTNETKDENFKAELTLPDSGGYSIEIIGTLVDGKTSTTFSDGELIINDGYSDEIVIDFEYSITIIDPKDISIDLDDSMSLVDYVEQQGTDNSGNI